MPLVSCRGIRKLFGDSIVLHGVELALERGERLGLVGANGSGKTTLCRILLNEDEPDGGTVTYAAGSTVGYLPQDPQLDPARSVQAEAMEAFADLQQLEADFAAASEAIGDPALADDPDELHRRMARQAALLAEMESRHGSTTSSGCCHPRALGWAQASAPPVGAALGGREDRLARPAADAGCDLLCASAPTTSTSGDRVLENFLAATPAPPSASPHRWFPDTVSRRSANGARRKTR